MDQTRIARVQRIRNTNNNWPVVQSRSDPEPAPSRVDILQIIYFHLIVLYWYQFSTWHSGYFRLPYYILSISHICRHPFLPPYTVPSRIVNAVSGASRLTGASPIGSRSPTSYNDCDWVTVATIYRFSLQKLPSNSFYVLLDSSYYTIEIHDSMPGMGVISRVWPITFANFSWFSSAWCKELSSRPSHQPEWSSGEESWLSCRRCWFHFSPTGAFFSTFRSCFFIYLYKLYQLIRTLARPSAFTPFFLPTGRSRTENERSAVL